MVGWLGIEEWRKLTAEKVVQFGPPLP
jgi:hypothetical protein